MDFFHQTNLILLCHQMNTKNEKARRRRRQLNLYKQSNQQSANESGTVCRAEAETLSAAQITNEAQDLD